MKTRKETPTQRLARRHEDVLEALNIMEQAGIECATGANDYTKRTGRARMAAAALVYAASVRRLAGVR